MEVIRETLWKRCLSIPTKTPAKNSNICLSETACQHKGTRKKCKKTKQGAIIQWQRQCLMDKPHRKPRPKSKTSAISKPSPSPLHHTFLLGRARFTAQPLSALILRIGSARSSHHGMEYMWVTFLPFPGLEFLGWFAIKIVSLRSDWYLEEHLNVRSDRLGEFKLLFWKPEMASLPSSHWSVQMTPTGSKLCYKAINKRYSEYKPHKSFLFWSKMKWNVLKISDARVTHTPTDTYLRHSVKQRELSVKFARYL